MGKLNMDAIKNKKAELQRGGGAGDIGFDRLESGKNVRRILPPKGDNDMFYSEGYVHYGLGEDGKAMVTCLETFGKKCPICEYLESIKNSKDKADKEFYNNARKNKRIYIAVLNRDSEDEDETPKVLSIGRMILKQLIDIICDPDYGDITDYEEGRDVTITKSGKGMNTEYSTLAKPKNTVASEQYSEEELDELIPDLESLFVEKSVDELLAILHGEGDDSEEDEDEDDDLEYDDMEIDDLKYLCKERGIPVPKKGCTKSKLISLLEEYDDEEFDRKFDEAEDEDDEYDEDSEEDEDEDDLMSSVKSAVKNKRSQKR